MNDLCFDKQLYQKERKLTEAICPRATVSPIASGAGILLSGLLGSITPNTTNTSTNPSMNSTPKP